MTNVYLFSFVLNNMKFLQCCNVAQSNISLTFLVCPFLMCHVINNFLNSEPWQFCMVTAQQRKSGYCICEPWNDYLFRTGNLTCILLTYLAKWPTEYFNWAVTLSLSPWILCSHHHCLCSAPGHMVNASEFR